MSEYTLKIPRKVADLRKVMANDMRIAVCGVYLDFKEMRAVATNGHMMAFVPLEDCPKELKGLFLSRDALSIIKDAPLEDVKIDIDIKKKKYDIVLHNYTARFDISDRDYPDYCKAIPTGEHDLEIGLDAKYLYKIVSAANPHGNHRCFLKIRTGLNKKTGDPKALEIEGHSEVGKIGVLMPVKRPN